MAWNDKVFRDIVVQRAAEIGKSQAQVLHEAGLSKGWMAPGDGRRIGTIEQIMKPLGWEPADLLNAITAAFEWPDTVTYDSYALSEHVADISGELAAVNQELSHQLFKLTVANAIIAHMRQFMPRELEIVLDATKKMLEGSSDDERMVKLTDNSGSDGLT
jgi:hypothetical protein